MIYRMGMSNHNAIGTDMRMPVLKRVLRYKKIERHKQNKQQLTIFPDKYHLLNFSA